MQALKASSVFASSHTITALFPPNSSNALPNLEWTFSLTIFPTFVLPVNEIKGNLWSLTSDSPISTPPVTNPRIEAQLWAYKTY